MRPGRRVICGFSGGDSAEDLAEIAGLVEQAIIKPVVDRMFQLDAIVDAHRYVETGRKRGGVVVAQA
jgi:NADPH:quinone reductase-like Zn-dependent oxidoreductase